MMSTPRQWSVVSAELGIGRGSEQSGTRPVIVVSRDSFNANSRLVHVLPITTLRPGRHIYSWEVALDAHAGGQPNDSVVLAQQGRTITHERIIHLYGEVTDPSIRAMVRDALRNFLDLR